jgi:hypothetical protein
MDENEKNYEESSNCDPFIKHMESFLERPEITRLQKSCINMALREYEHIQRSLKLIEAK